MDTRNESQFPNPDAFKSTDRWSFFNQIIIGRKISDKFSVQVSGSISHFNAVYPAKDPETGAIQELDNDHFAIAIAGRYKISPPLTTHASADFDSDETEPKPNLSFGVEFTTSAHQFQIFFGNYGSIVPQINNAYNTAWGFGNSDFALWDPEWRIGFNMTRLWSY